MIFIINQIGGRGGGEGKRGKRNSRIGAAPYSSQHLAHGDLPTSRSSLPIRHPQDDEKGSPDSVEPEDLCCFWRAGRAITAGEHVCNRYGYMAPDQVGFGLDWLTDA